MFSGGQWRDIRYAHVQWWSMEGYQICSCVRVVYAMVDTMIYADSIKDAQMS